MRKWLIIIAVIGMFGIVFFLLPNIFYSEERSHYSNEVRISHAIEHYNIDSLTEDTLLMAPSTYYHERSRLHLWLFGEKYRKLWQIPVKVPVFTWHDSTQTYDCYDIGGGEQTIAIEIKDKNGRIWTVRSIDKDQSGALSDPMKYTIVRPLIRDETAAMNPYAAFVVDDLSEYAGIPHTRPRLVFIPYLSKWTPACRDRMAGRMAMVEEELDEEGWSHNELYFNADTIVDSDDMLDQLKVFPDRTIDTLSYLKARLFDILISDWDRHEGNWAWALKEDTYIPIPIDRDMAFYLFDDGIINKIFLVFNSKFRSFHEDYSNVSGFSKNSEDIDQMILPGVKKEYYEAYADSIIYSLTDSLIEKSFHEYPDEVYRIYGDEHINILKSRRDKLKKAAKEFFAAIND